MLKQPEEGLSESGEVRYVLHYSLFEQDLLYGVVGLHHYLPMIEEAVCASDTVDPEIFFPTKPVNQVKIKVAVDICKSCPVIHDCLDYALRNNINYGVWGGTSATQRQALRKLGGY